MSLQGWNDLVSGAHQQSRAAVLQVHPGLALRLQEGEVGGEAEILQTAHSRAGGFHFILSFLKVTQLNYLSEN